MDTQGSPMHAIVHATDIQDRDGGVLLMATLSVCIRSGSKLHPDGGYAGPQFQARLARIMRRVQVEIVKRSDAAGASPCCRSAGSSSAPLPG